MILISIRYVYKFLLCKGFIYKYKNLVTHLNPLQRHRTGENVENTKSTSCQLIKQQNLLEIYRCNYRDYNSLY